MISVAARERTLADVARTAMDGCDDYQDAARRLLRLVSDDERRRLLEPYEENAALDLIRATAGSFRKSVWTPPAPQTDRIAALARSNRASLLDFPLPGGLPLRAARRSDVEEAVRFYAERAEDMAHKSRWLTAIAGALEQDETVADALSADDLANMQETTK